MFHRLFALVALTPLVACSGSESGGTEETGTDTHDHMDHSDLDLSVEKMTDGGTYMVAYSTMPSPIPLNEDFMVMVQLTDMDGTALQATSLDVDATMPDHGHGMNVDPMIMDMGDGMWHADGMRLLMEVYWELVVSVDGVTAAFDIDCCEAGGGSM